MDTLPLDTSLQSFLAQNILNIVFIIVVGSKALIGGTSDLRTRLIGVFFILAVLYIGHLVDVEWYTQAITFAWYVTIAIALRVIALKVFYLLIDLND
jgi:hypothetical protein